MSQDQQVKKVQQLIDEITENDMQFYSFYEEKFMAKCQDPIYIKALVKQLIQYLGAEKLLQPQRSFFTLQLLKETFEQNNKLIAQSLLKQDELLDIFSHIALHNKESKDPNRGKTLFPGDLDTQELGKNFLKILLELIEYLALRYQQTQQKKPTKFVEVYKKLLSQGVTFPQNYEFLQKYSPNNKAANQKPAQQTTPQPVNQSQHVGMSQHQQQSSHVNMKELQNEINSTIQQTEEMIEELVKSLNSQKQTTQGHQENVGLTHEIIQDYGAQIDKHVNTLQQAGKHSYKEAQEDLDDLLSLRIFIDQFNKEYQTVSLNGFEQEKYRLFRNKVMKIGSPYCDNVKLDFESTPTKKSQQQHQGGSNEWGNNFGGFDSQQQQQQKPATNKQASHDFNDFGSSSQHQQQQSQFDSQKQQSKKQNDFADNPYGNFDSNREAESQKIADKLIGKQDSQEEKKESFKDLWGNSQQKSKKTHTSAYQSHTQKPVQHQPPQQTQWNSNIQSQFQPIHEMDEAETFTNTQNQFPNLNQSSYNNNNQQQQSNNNLSNTRKQQNYTVNEPPPNRYQQQLQKQMERFDEQFSVGMSVMSATSADFPMKNKEVIDDKVYEGRLIAYDRQVEDIIESSKINDSMIRKFKSGNLKKKYLLIDNSEVQFGVKTELIFDYMTNKNHLLLSLFVGNKSQNAIQNIKLDYFGDHTVELWKKQDGDIEETLEVGKQIRQDFILQYHASPYDLINGEFSCLINNEKNVCQKFFLPNLLTKYMTFKETDAFVFKSKWELKRENIIKSEFFTINTRIIRNPQDFIKYFHKSIEFTNINEFLSQRHQNPGEKLKYYELGGIFELNTPNIEYLIRITVRPNLTAIIQIIPYSSYIATAETVLNHLVYIFSK